MLVREIMHADPTTIRTDVSLQEAYAVMQERQIRHLPVVAGDGRVVGVVTDRDLRLATSALATQPFPPGARVEEVMTQPVQTADPLDPVEVAARTMRELRIGCLPVVEDDRLIGIVTGIDLLEAMLRLTGVHKPSGRLEVAVADRPGELARLTTLLGSREVNIQSILSYPGPGDDDTIRIVLRIASIDPRPLAEALCRSGFEVVWPPHVTCR